MGAVLSHTSEVFESLCRYDFLTQVLAVEPDGRERVDPVSPNAQSRLRRVQ